jgi:dihydrofolate reductase
MRMSQRIRVQNFTVSQDGYGTGEEQTLERPFGHANPGELIAWGFDTASFPGRTESGGSRGLDDYFTRDFDNRIGAEIMGRNKFGPQRGRWTDHEWVGWWGDTPPFHTPVFVLTHHERPSITLADTTFHFLDATPAEAAEQAKAAAKGLDVRVGGGPTTLRTLIDARHVDHHHLVLTPKTHRGGVPLLDTPEHFYYPFNHETEPSPTGVIHHNHMRSQPTTEQNH